MLQMHMPVAQRREALRRPSSRYPVTADSRAFATPTAGFIVERVSPMVTQHPFSRLQQVGSKASLSWSWGVREAVTAPLPTDQYLIVHKLLNLPSKPDFIALNPFFCNFPI